MCFAYDRMTAKKEKSMNCYLICVFVANGCRTKNELPICGAKMQPRSCYCLLYIETFKMECVLFFVFFFLPLLPYIAPRFFFCLLRGGRNCGPFEDGGFEFELKLRKFMGNVYIFTSIVKKCECLCYHIK